MATYQEQNGVVLYYIEYFYIINMLVSKSELVNSYKIIEWMEDWNDGEHKLICYAP